jgi:hypothetical protein
MWRTQRLKAIFQKLSAEHAQVSSSWHELSLRMEVGDGRGLVATCNEMHCSVLHKLQLLDVAELGIWIPKSAGIVQDGFN